MKVAIVGSGYVGLVTGACFSEVGIDVVCVDVDKEKIQNLNASRFARAEERKLPRKFAKPGEKNRKFLGNRN